MATELELESEAVIKVGKIPVGVKAPPESIE
jgi:hypothetical protein